MGLDARNSTLSPIPVVATILKFANSSAESSGYASMELDLCWNSYNLITLVNSPFFSSSISTLMGNFMTPRDTPVIMASGARNMPNVT